MDGRAFSALLREARDRSGLTQTKIGEAVGTCLAGAEITQQHVHNWCSGRNLPRDRQTLLCLCQVLHAAGGLRSLDQINALLRAAGQGALFKDEQTELFPGLSETPAKRAVRAPDSSGIRSQRWVYATPSGGVASVATPPDGGQVVVGTQGKEVLGLTGAGALRWRRAVENEAWQVVMSQDGAVIVAGTGSTRPWDLKGRGLYIFNADGTLRWQEALQASVSGLALSPDGTTLAVGTDARPLLLYDTRGHRLWQEQVPGLGWYAWVWSTALSSDGELIAAGTADNRLRLLRRSGQQIGELRTAGVVYAVAVAPDGTTVVAGDNKGGLYWLDGGGRLLWQARVPDAIWFVALTHGAQQVVVGFGEQEGYLHAYSREGRQLWRHYVGEGVSKIALSADGAKVIAGTRQGGIFVFEHLEVVLHAQVEGAVCAVAMAEDGTRAVAGSDAGKVYGFDLSKSP